MPFLNEYLTVADYNNLTQDERSGFNDIPRVVTLHGPFKLYKLTGDYAPQRGDSITPWWSAVLPFEEDEEGAKGRYVQAYMNILDMSSMGRLMCNVQMEWNEMKYYIEIEIRGGDHVSCFWGRYAPKPLTQVLPGDQITIRRDGISRAFDRDAVIEANSRTGFESSMAGYSDAVLGNTLGIGTKFEERETSEQAWQFYVPNLTDQYLSAGEHRRIIDAHNMPMLGKYLNIDLGNPKHVKMVWELLKDFKRDTQLAYGRVFFRDPKLVEMDKCVDEIHKFKVNPLTILSKFNRLGLEYISQTKDRIVRGRVEAYLDKTRMEYNRLNNQ